MLAWEDDRITSTVSLISHNIKDFPDLVFHYKIEEMKTSYLTMTQFEANFSLGKEKDLKNLPSNPGLAPEKNWAIFSVERQEGGCQLLWAMS